jgi:AcrR family transcriptional regulator
MPPKSKDRVRSSGTSARQIVASLVANIMQNGPPLPGYSQIAETSGVSRQLVRYHFPDPDDMLCEACNFLAEAYRIALVNGLASLTGPARLRFIFDFYFNLIEAVPKPRDDQAYDAMMALAARSPRVKANLRAQYTLVGQVMQMELKAMNPQLSLDACGEIGYLFVCLMYGHWKMVATLGVGAKHNIVSRRAIDRIIQSYLADADGKGAGIRTWTD